MENPQNEPLSSEQLNNFNQPTVQQTSPNSNTPMTNKVVAKNQSLFGDFF